VKKAFRKLAMKYHPDRNSGNRAAESLFKEISEAYEILTHKEKRKAFHEAFVKYTAKTARSAPTATAAAKKTAPAPSSGKIGKNLIYHLNLSFEDAMNGIEKNISYVRMAHGKRQTSQIPLTIPAGTREGQKFRLRGAGESVATNQTPGDLVVVAHISTHPLYTFDGDDIIATIPISPLDLLLNEKLTIPTPAGPVEIDKLTWEEIARPTLRLKDRGFFRSENPKRRGDLFVRFVIEVPPTLDENLKERLRQIKKSLPKTQAQTEFEKLLRS
jgi:DnaJ-class molecular chaperone